MSTSKTYQQSLTDAGSETRPPMLERGSYIPWASRFRRYINRKRENQNWLNKALDEGPYQFQMFIPNNSTVPKLETTEDLQGDALLHYDAEMELMNLILLSILNNIYNSVDACTSAKEMWKRVERLMRGTIQNKVDRETHFTNEFDQFVAELGEALVSVYNRFAQLMNDLERNDMHFPIQFKKLVNASRAKKLEKSQDLLALVAHTGSSSRTTSSYYVTHPTSVVDYDNEYQQDDVQTNSEDPLASAMLLLARAVTQNFSNPTNNRLRTSSNTRNQAIIQGDRVNIQSRNSGLFELHLQETLQLFNATTVVEKDIMLEIVQSQGFGTRNTSWNKCCWQKRMRLKTSSSFKTTGLLQPWQTLCMIFSKCLTTRVAGWDQPPLQIMQMIFTKIIIGHFMTKFPEISRRARDKYHNLKNDDIMKNIFNSGRYKDKVGTRIPAWMISEEMKHTEHYRMYAEVFRIDVPLTQSQPTESTQGTHRTPSAPRSPNHKKDAAESSPPKRSNMICFCIPKRRSTRLTPPAPVPTIDKVDEMILQDTLQVSLVEHKSREEQEARENVELVNKHLASEEIEKLVEGQENVIDDSSIPRNDEPNIPGTKIEPRSDNESPEVEITNAEEVEITNVVIPVNVDDEADEITDEVYELKRREKGKIVEESRSTPFLTPTRSLRIHTDLASSDTEKLQELMVPSTKLSTINRLLSLFKAQPARFKRYRSFFQELQGRYGYLFENIRARFMPMKSFDKLVDHLQDVRDQVPVYVAEGLILERQKTKDEMEMMIAKAILQERGNIQAEISSQIQKAIDNNILSQVDAFVRNYMSGHILHVHTAQPQTTSVPEQQYQLYIAMKDDPQLQQQDIAIWLALQMNAKRQKTSEYEAYVSGESSSGQANEEEQCPSTSGNQEKVDDYDFWTESYASDDDEIPTKQVTQDIMEEVSLTIDEAKLKKIADEMLRQRCTSRDEHQYHIDQMKNFLQSDIVWESRKEILVSLHPQKTTPLVQSWPEKIVLLLHKFHAVIFNDDDIKERTSRWKAPGKPKEEIYSNSKIIQVIKMYRELGHEHKFITKIVARRANECIVSITETDYKNLNKNDIEDMYLLIMNGKVAFDLLRDALSAIFGLSKLKVVWVVTARVDKPGHHVSSNFGMERVASLKPKSTDKGRRYKRKKETKGKKVVTSLDFQEEVDTAKGVNTAEGVNTGSIKVSTVSEQVSTGSTKRSIPSPDKGQREGKAHMIIEEAPKKRRKWVKQSTLDSLLAQRIAGRRRIEICNKEKKDQSSIEAQINR
ncbi:hypothetical protein Tco_0556549 [Tanacetum coccineum]